VHPEPAQGVVDRGQVVRRDDRRDQLHARLPARFPALTGS
jgi:hypothetical protein